MVEARHVFAAWRMATAQRRGEGEVGREGMGKGRNGQGEAGREKGRAGGWGRHAGGKARRGKGHHGN